MLQIFSFRFRTTISTRQGPVFHRRPLHQGIGIIFATERSSVATTDPQAPDGVTFDRFGEKPEAIAACRELEKDIVFLNP
jgi:hypothetical protein